MEKQSRVHDDPLSTLSGQVPLPTAEVLTQNQLALVACALLTRDFNGAMGLPKGELPRCVDQERGAVYGRMLREEVRKVEDAVRSGLLHEVLAESVDVLYLTFNLLQECGLEKAIEPAFLLKHEDNMKKQHETVADLSLDTECVCQVYWKVRSRDGLYCLEDRRRQVAAVLSRQAGQAL